jgi:hypothetical protein
MWHCVIDWLHCSLLGAALHESLVACPQRRVDFVKLQGSLQGRLLPRGHMGQRFAYRTAHLESMARARRAQHHLQASGGEHIKTQPARCLPHKVVSATGPCSDVPGQYVRQCMLNCQVPGVLPADSTDQADICLTCKSMLDDTACSCAALTVRTLIVWPHIASSSSFIQGAAVLRWRACR